MKTLKLYHLKNSAGLLYCKDAQGAPIGFVDYGFPVAVRLPIARAAVATLAKRYRVHGVTPIPANPGINRVPIP